MWEELLSMAVNNGIWAVMFCCLLIHQIRDSKQRENKYVETIKDLRDTLKTVREIKKTTDEISAKLAAKNTN